MRIYKNIKKVIKKKNLMYYLVDVLRFLPDDLYLKLVYRIKIGKKLNIKNPISFNEKIQWLKINDRNYAYIKMVDKYEAKKYVASILGTDCIIPTLGIWNSFDEIDFEQLPSQFVLKCTHDSGTVVLCEDKTKFDYIGAKKKLNRALKRNFYWIGREWPYKFVKPRILAEKYMLDNENSELIDYKFMCFNGKVKTVFTCSERYSEDGLKVTFYDRRWKRLPFKRHYPSSKSDLSCPSSYNEMMSYAEILSKDISFLRVDFYEIKGRPYFGELTFYPGDGFEEFTPDEWDYKLGSWLNLI